MLILYVTRWYTATGSCVNVRVVFPYGTLLAFVGCAGAAAASIASWLRTETRVCSLTNRPGGTVRIFVRRMVIPIGVILRFLGNNNGVNGVYLGIMEKKMETTKCRGL